ncbi:MAG TPA: COX15/CtaA family protein [Jatrophihabitans sp.]|nr:COX15/CtaA family protein [Jatrophihabitans sp.]
MGMTTAPGVAATPAPRQRSVRWLPKWLQTAAALRRLALASVVANVVIVVTGGAVRLTDSGLGCPTWPSCTAKSLTPTKQYAIHGIIEFTNRQITFVLVAVALATWVVAMVRRRERRLATLAALGIPAQAVLGGLTVLTHLNPWLVAAHFLLSAAIIAATFVLWWRLRVDDPAVASPATSQAAPAVRILAQLTTLVSAATLVIGTVVTGSGPHAGDKAADGTVHRTGLNVASMAQLHADVVMILIGLTVGLVVLVRAVRVDPTIRRAADVLLGIELAQGVIGYTQYFLHVPPLLVGVHMLGACLVWLAALNVVLRSGGSPAPASTLAAG